MGADIAEIGTAQCKETTVGVDGEGPGQQAFASAVYGNVPLLIVLLAVLTFLLLARAFRSVLLAVKAGLCLFPEAPPQAGPIDGVAVCRPPKTTADRSRARSNPARYLGDDFAIMARRDALYCFRRNTEGTDVRRRLISLGRTPRADVSDAQPGNDRTTPPLRHASPLCQGRVSRARDWMS